MRLPRILPRHWARAITRGATTDMSGTIDALTARSKHYVNGSRTAHLDPEDRGLAYGDGLFETMACRHGTIALLDYHLDRLIHGCRRLAMPVSGRDALRNEIMACCSEETTAVVKLTLTRGVGQRGYRIPESATPSTIVSVTPWSGYPREHYTEGVDIDLCVLRLAENPQLAGLKHLCRLEQVLAATELGRDADEGLLRDQSGRVIGGTASNVFGIAGQRLLTPLLNRCGVHGVMRRVVLAHAAETGLEPQECELTLDQLHTCDELFITNALAGIRPIRRLGTRLFAVGSQTLTLMRHLTAIGQPQVLDDGNA